MTCFQNQNRAKCTYRKAGTLGAIVGVGCSDSGDEEPSGDMGNGVGNETSFP
jgi:hypothetical protein